MKLTHGPDRAERRLSRARWGSGFSLPRWTRRSFELSKQVWAAMETSARFPAASTHASDTLPTKRDTFPGVLGLNDTRESS